MKKYLISGLLIWVPIWVVFLVLRFFVDLLDKSMALIPTHYRPEQLFGIHIPGLGIVLTLAILLLTGLMVTNFIGKRLVAWWERLVSRIPLIRSLYGAVKKLINAFIAPEQESFRKVLLVEYPRAGIWSMGFQTAGSLSANPTGEDLVSVFIPTTPNPTSGFLIFPKRSETTELNISVEQAFRLIVSLGVVHPDVNNLLEKKS